MDKQKNVSNRKGVKLSDETKRKISESRRGKPAWNKGIPMSKEAKEKLGKSKNGKPSWNKGIPCTDEHKAKISKSNIGKVAWNKGIPSGRHTSSEFKEGETAGENNFKWAGDSVKYRSLHRWVERTLGVATKCKECGKERNGKNVHWSNDNHTYKRETKGRTQLCVRCHKKHDKVLRGLNPVNSGNIL